MLSCCFPSPSRQQQAPGNPIQDPTRRAPDDAVTRTRERASQTSETDSADHGHHAPAAGCGGATQTADASMHGALSYDDLSVLHFFQGERCDVLFTSTRFQGSSIAALLKGVLCSIDQGCGGAEQSDKSKVFLEMLLGAERAQAAEAAVLEGLPFVTVIEKELPVLETGPQSVGSESCCSSLPHSAAKLAKLALQSDSSRPPSSLSRCMQVNFGRGPATSKDMPSISTEQQQSIRDEQSAGLPMSKDGLPFQAKFLSEPFVLRPAASQRPALTTLPEDSSSHNNIQSTDQQFLDGSASAMGVSTPSTSHPLHASWSAASFADPPAASTSTSGPSAQPSISLNNKATYARHYPSGSGKYALMPKTHSGESSTVQGSRSKTLPLFSSSTCGVYEPLSSNLSGEFDRTLAMLQALQLERSPSPSNQALPALTSSASKFSTAGGARRRPARKVASCTSMGMAAQYPSSAADMYDMGLHIGDLGERERPLSTGPKSSPAAADYAEPLAAATQTEGTRPSMQGGAVEERQGACQESQQGVLVSGRPRSSKEKSGASSTCPSNAAYVRQDSQADGSQASLEEQIFEVSIQSMPSARGRRRKAVGMVSIVDITAQLQAQAALLSLAEGQLSLLSSFLPRHAIEFLARRDSNADTIPQNVGKLARSHKMATVLFMDICGFTSLSKSVEPHEVMQMLNTLFSSVDKLTDKYKVHKVETAGDCYIVSSGVLSDQTYNGFSCTLDHHDRPGVSAGRVMEFAKAVLQETAKVNMPYSSDPVQMRVGIHSGDVVSGLIGTKLPKFSIFGDTMNTAARMESTGKPGRIHVSETTQGLLPEYAWESVGVINVKGKGMMQTYLWDSGRGWSQQAIQQQQQQQLIGEESGSPTVGIDNTGPLSLAINVIKGLTALKSRSSNELEQALT